MFLIVSDGCVAYWAGSGVKRVVVVLEELM